jgi:DNA-binding transcriptional MerR regulator
MRQVRKKSAAAVEVPNKLYFRIGDVAALCGVETYVLRFWETEFPQLKPGKSGTGQRLYRRREVEFALHLKRLLHEQGYTIAGARQALKAEARAVPQEEMPFARDRQTRAKLEKARQEARALLALLTRDGAAARPATPPKKHARANINLPRAPGPELFS